MVVRISSEIEINRSPAEVRAVFLNFDDWRSWLTTGLTLKPRDKSKPGADLKPGDQLRGNFRGTAIKPKVLENTPSKFEWRGKVGKVLVIGHRRFYFHDSEKTPGWTRLVQSEDISGWLAFMFKKDSGGQGKIARDAMTKFNEEIKTRAE
ncbi:hypothetical protein MFIFM68171_03625 [Madurella fahalii]|uniref:Polyketide cyclase n=1 Tax=Madurella fahalii TaxID=1157608 RepID=A0ABQ0G6P0_9PEZI